MTLSRRLLIPVAAALMITVAAACSAPQASPSSQDTAVQPTSQPAAIASTNTPVAVATNTPQPEPTEAPTVAPSPEPTVTSEPTSEPTPQPTGLEALAAAFPDAPQAAGEVILLTGKVLDSNGDPIEGASVEIWQTDAKGVYDHPGDSSTASRDRDFQFYGHSVTDATGAYLFRTIMPGEYEPRPRHIHVKVKIDGAEALTTQFYFDEDRAALRNEGLFQQAGSLGELLILKSAGSVDMTERTANVLTNDLVIATGAGSLTPTPPQGEGPYYPVVTVAEYDNDLTVVQ